MISNLLLDIEGTTCPVSFVGDILFPYAAAQLQPYIEQHHNEVDIQHILQRAMEEYNQDESWPPGDGKKTLLSDPSEDRESIASYLLHLINIDKKSTALKDLQGRIWKQGYSDGDIKSTLFSETATCLNDWTSMGLTLAVYSSGSIEAQQLLYQHTPSGDLRSMFSHWFDTHTGPKKEKNSYTLICEKMTVAPDKVLFISDSGDECDAAQQAGLRTLFSRRNGNPDQDPRGHQWVDSLNDVSTAIKQER